MTPTPGQLTLVESLVIYLHRLNGAELFASYLCLFIHIIDTCVLFSDVIIYVLHIHLAVEIL